MEEKRYENEQKTFFSSSFFPCHFLKPLKFVWGLPKWEFLPGKRAFRYGKNREK